LLAQAIISFGVEEAMEEGRMSKSVVAVGSMLGLAILSVFMLWGNLHLKPDPVLAIDPEDLRSYEALMVRSSDIVHVGVVAPLLLVACVGLFRRKLWGALTAMTGLGVYLAFVLEPPARVIALRQTGTSTGELVAYLGFACFFAIWIGGIGFLFWRDRELLD
jgi:hypothetical protein